MILYRKHPSKKSSSLADRKQFIYNLSLQLMEEQKAYHARYFKIFCLKRFSSKDYIAAGFRKISETFTNILLKISGRKPSKVHKCPICQTSVRDQNMGKCMNCELLVCQDHLVQKIFCDRCDAEPGSMTNISVASTSSRMPTRNMPKETTSKKCAFCETGFKKKYFCILSSLSKIDVCYA